jgi:peptide deformylase
MSDANDVTRKIIVFGHDTLRRHAKLVPAVDDSIRELVDSMFATMYGAPGIGLAAPQVDESLAVIVVHPRSEEEETRALALINPETLDYGGRSTFEEGCLSVPGIFEDIRRPSWIKARYLDFDGAEVTEEFDGLMARVIQHEMDHLKGKLFIDHLSPMRRALIKRRLRNIQAD